MCKFASSCLAWSGTIATIVTSISVFLRMKVFQSSIFRSLFAIGIGVFLLLRPDSTAQYLTIAIGILFLLSGIISCVDYFYTVSHWQERQEVDQDGHVHAVSKPWFPVGGVGSILLGFILALMPDMFVKSLVYLMAVVIIIGALHQLFNLVGAARHYGMGPSYWMLPSLLLVAGIVMLVKPMLVAGIPFMVLGICLLVYGVSDCINSFVIHRKRKKAVRTTLPMERGEYVDYEEVKE